MGRLDGRVAIVTGAAQGLGAAYAREFAKEGAKIAVCDLLDCANVVDSIKRQDGQAIGMRCDVSDERQIADVAAKAIQAFGKVDILVANAALSALVERRSFLEIPVEEWDRLMAVNCRGVYLSIKAVVPDMKKRKYGKIVTITSGTMHSGVPHLLHYVASKGAVHAMTRALARELGDDGIRINSICPGLTMSEQIAAQREKIQGNVEWSVRSRAIKRDEQPEDLVGTAVFLASAESDFITGQTIVVDGGLVMH
jgi:NAD(P)-dependent dehydrogenase (short-subunit alcohol dehydrogenase family)